MNPILFRGVDGTTLDPKTIRKHTTLLHSIFGPKSAIGCAISHLSVWKSFLKSKNSHDSHDSHAVIFEDDIIFDIKPSKFKKTIQFYIDKTPNDFDILYLGSFGNNGSNNSNFFTWIMKVLNMSSKYKSVNEYISKPDVALAAHAYILSRKGAKKLIKHLEGKIHHHIDYCIQYLASKDLINTYITKPRIVFQTSTDSTPSSNVSTHYPILINRILSDFYLDTKVKASYLTTLSVFRLGSFNITISMLLIFIFLIRFYITEGDFTFLSAFLFSISLPDFI
jgi:GR25 family glycosyltransferase involved in LPS biosynthesis